MSKRKKIFLWIMGGAGALMVLLLAFLLAAPKLINLEPIKEKVLAQVSQQVGGEFEFQRVDFSILPRPYVVIHGASLSIPDTVNGTLESLSVYVKILPLLKGKLRLAKVQVEAPDFKMKLPERPEKSTESPKSAPLGDIEETLTRLLAPLALNAPDLVVVVKKGRLDFSEENESVFSFQNIDARFVLPPTGFKIYLTCASNLWEKIGVVVTLNSEDFKGNGRIDLIRFYPQLLTGYLFPKATPRIGESAVNLSLTLEADGLKDLNGEVQGSIPYLTLHQANEKLVIKGKSLKTSFHLAESKTTVSITELNLDYPQINMSGGLLIDQTSEQVNLELEGRDVDVQSAREVALAVAGDEPDVQEVFGIVRGGKVPLVTLEARGSSLADLGDLENITIKGSMVEGKILISHEYTGIQGIDLDLGDVKGETVISKGILEGKALEARVGNSWGREGTLKVGLKGEDKTFQLDIKVQADVAELPPILKGVVKNKAHIEEINRVDNLKGRVTGRLVLGESTKRINVRVDASEINLSAKYEKIPFPLKITAGQMSTDGMSVEYKDLMGNIGKSSFSGLSGRVDWRKTPRFDVEIGKMGIVLEEITPWLTSFEKFPVQSKDIKSVAGVITFSQTRLKGPLLRPVEWRYESKGELRNVRLNWTLLPGPLEMTRGNLDVIDDAKKQKIFLRGVQISILDASLIGSGTLYDFKKGLNRVDLNLQQGVVGAQGLEWMSKFIQLPSEIKIDPPLSISKTHLVWERRGNTTFTGNMAIQDGPRIIADILVNPDELNIKKLLIQDKESNASLSLNFKDKALSLSFAGNLIKTTVDRLLTENKILGGWIKGDFKSHIFMDHPHNSTLEGELHGENLIYPRKLETPLTIDSISLHAQKDRFRVESANITWGDSHLRLEGNMDFPGHEIALDMDLTADTLDLDNVLKTLDKDDEEKEEEAKEHVENSWPLPMRGVMRFKTDDFKYKTFTWNPFHADISFLEQGMEVALTEAVLCGISTPGVVKVTPEDLSLNFKPSAKNQPLHPTLDCLLGGRVKATGILDLKGKVTARGKPEALAKSIQGHFEILAKDGRIQQSVPMEKLFAHLSLTEVFRGQLPEMKKEGFLYESITAKGNLENSKLVLNEGYIDGLSMEIACQGYVDFPNEKVDLTFLAAPLKTIDSIVKRIPGLNYILGGTLVSVPVRVKGDLRNPQVIPLSASAVGSNLLGIMERTIKLPVKILEPVIPKDKEEQGATEE
jgi:hypothetical protein